MNTANKPTKNVFLLFVIFFIYGLIPNNKLCAQGPNAPEAASFEPVDATDMVNLVTGDLSYVLPLLNVPSPEGGYPIALSYHAGIAMEQEASWVGLGWSLNPGTINRGVNGYPDDWGKTNVNEFFYDAGWTEESFSIGAGVTFQGGISVGLGLSWGTNQSLGGYVSATIGLGGDGSPSIGGRIGTNGVSINGGVGGFNASFGTSGVGIGYGPLKGDGEASVGLNLNYNYSSGLSGGISVSQKNGNFEGTDIGKYSSMGINFSSSGVSANAKINGSGAGISRSVNNITYQDYDINSSSTGISIPVYIFYISFSHQKVTYSLYKYNNLHVAGMGYPYYANEVRFPEETTTASLLEENHFMDVNTISKFDGTMIFDELLETTDQLENNNLILPNYDNYTLTAQGLSGSIKPISYDELNLSARGRNVRSNEESYGGYLNLNNDKGNPFIDTHEDVKLEDNLFFSFDNSFNSFLRTDKSNIIRIPDYFGDTSAPTTSRYGFTEYYGTTATSTYNNFTTPDGEKLTETYAGGYKRRTGNSVVTYTNKQIRDSYQNGVSTLYGFIDATEYKVINNISSEQVIDRTDTETFLDNGIGAYTITTMDGKVYHYSLPVYNFESFYRNYKNKYDKDENFFEISKLKPYATHWLLTGVTGPDYIDINDNGKLDEDDYGYWVSFDYGKWTDGYAWTTPTEEIKDNEKIDEINYSYSWGRKQIYYLDAIKTRTHTALFVKDVREDNLSYFVDTQSGPTWVPGNDFIWDTYATKYTKNKYIDLSGETLYSDLGVEIVIPENIQGFYYDCSEYVRGKETSYRYVDIPRNKTLKLDKILLFKNEDINLTDLKNSTNPIVQSDVGRLTFASGYSDIEYFTDTQLCSGPHIDFTNQVLYSDNISNLFMKEFDIHQHQNVLDVNDVDYLYLEEKAQQVIRLSHDYTLAKDTPNSQAETDQGKLTLKELEYKGKKGVQLVPPYKFSYHRTESTYNKDQENAWGYRRFYPYQWSLKNITTPTGGDILIDYESDTYKTAINNYIVFANKSERFPTTAPQISSINVLDKTDFNDNGKKCVITILDTELTDATNIGMGDALTTQVGDKFYVDYVWYYWNATSFITADFDKYVYKGQATVTSLLSSGSTEKTYELTFDNNIIYDSTQPIGAPFIFPEPFFPKNFDEDKSSASDVYYRIKVVKDIDYIQNSGGLRTKQIAVFEDYGEALTTIYIYNNPLTNETSGITSYTPFTIQQNIVPYVSELPPPSTMYGHVKMENYDEDDVLLGSTVFEFETLESIQQETGYIFSLGDAFKVKENQDDTFENGLITANKYTLYNKLSNLGRIITTKSYNSKGQLLNENSNNYKANLDADGEIGVTQESYKSLKYIVNNDDDSEDYLISSTSRINYPSVLESTTTNQGGFSSTTAFNKHDFLTGQAIETTAKNSKGDEFKTEITPAYTVAEYNSNGGYSMGSKVDDETNKNMLIQEAMSKTYLKVGNDWKETGVGITTWNNYWAYTNVDGSTSIPTNSVEKVWRKHKNFIWDGDLDTDGTYSGFTGDDDSFDWALQTNSVEITQSNSKWKNTSTTTQYDHYSAPLEIRDINDNYASTKMCDDNSKVLAVSNAQYTEMFYSGAEYITSNTSYFDGQVKSTGQNTTEAHTGTHSVSVASGAKGFEVNMVSGEHRSGKYKISVWIEKTAYTNARININGSTKTFNGEEVFAGNWVLKTHYENLSSSAETVYVTSNSGTVYFDDFKLHPIASSMSSYVYNEWDELWYIIGNNGLATMFEYDSAGRLKKTYTEVEDFNGTGTGGFKQVSNNSYNYKKPL